MNAKLLGMMHKRMGKSIHYNPYRNKGTAKQFNAWLEGYNRRSEHASQWLKQKQAPLSGLFIVLAFSDFYDNEDRVMSTRTDGRKKTTGKKPAKK